jgi:FkbM family methyltransferase
MHTDPVPDPSFDLPGRSGPTLHGRPGPALKAALHDALERYAPSLLHRYQMARTPREAEHRLVPLLCDRTLDAVDVGANWGIYTHVMAANARHVHAFEPVPVLASRLSRTVPRNVTVHETALSDHDGTALLTVAGGEYGLSSLHLQQGDGHIDVQLTTLDHAVQAPIGFIKIDVEGHEQEVLAGALRILALDRPVLLVEIEERHRPGAIEAVRSLLSGLHYRGWFVLDDLLLPIERWLPVPHPGEPLSGGQPVGAYINNFLFFHRSEEERMLRRMRSQGRLTVRT